MAENNVKIFKRSDIKKNDDNKRVRVIIHNNVYDVTDFLNEHPGGEEVLLEQGGEDATEAFEDVAHSLDARNLMNKYKIGELDESEKVKTQEKIMKDWADKKDEHGSNLEQGPFSKCGVCPRPISKPSGSLYSYREVLYFSWKSWTIPVVLAVLATLVYRFYFHH